MAEASGSGGANSSIKSLRERKSITAGMYTCWGTVPLENCVTAVPENLLVNFGPLPVPSKGSKRGGNSYSNNNNDDGDGESGGSEGTDRILVGVVHLDTLLIHEMNPDTRKEFSSKHIHTVQLPSSLHNRCIILRAKWIALKNGSVKVLLLCTNLATYFYNEMGTKQITKWDYDPSAAAAGASGGAGRGEELDLSRCSRTIAGTNDYILLGNDHGDVHLFTYETPRKGGPVIQMSKTLKLCSEPVAEMCGKRSGLLVVGTPTGNLSVWTGFQGEASQPVKSTEYVLSKPEPVTGILLWYPYGIVSYGSGIIRMYNLIQKVLSAQVYAHGRWISSMDLCPSQNLLLTIAEDDEARVWTLRRRQKGELRSPIKLHSSIQIEDANLIGGKFLSGTGTVIGLTNLSCKDVAVYTSEEFSS